MRLAEFIKTLQALGKEDQAPPVVVQLPDGEYWHVLNVDYDPGLNYVILNKSDVPAPVGDVPPILFEDENVVVLDLGQLVHDLGGKTA
jgi:hypothetical protein